jgi:hypothetical protein
MLVMRQELILCECSSLEHQVVISYEEDYEEMYFHIHLSKPRFLRRLKYAIRYLLGYRSRYGAFEEVIISKDKFKETFEKVVR